MYINDENIDFRESIIEHLIKISNQFSKRFAISVEGKLYSYQKLFSYAKLIAMQLQKYSEQRCVIIANRNLTAYASLLGVLLAGKAYIFLNTKDSIERINDNFLCVNTSLLICDSNNQPIANKLFSLSNKMIQIFHFDFEEFESLNSNYSKLKKTYLYAYMMFTSGSTGKPKCVPVSHANLKSYLENIIQRLKPTECDRFSQITELTFDLSVHDIFTCWSVGACLYILPENHIIGIPKYIKDNKISFWCSVPSTIHLLHQLKRLSSPFLSIRYSIFCGEALSNDLAKLWHQYTPNSAIDNFYGPTEATVAIMAYRWQPDLENNIVPLGYPFPNQFIFLLDSNLKPVKKNQIAEIFLSGAQVTQHYWNNPQLSNEKYICYKENKMKFMAYRTGDLAYFDPNYGYIFKGRSDDQMKIRGYRVEKIEVESILKTITKTELTAVLPYKQDLMGNVLSLICFLVNPTISMDEIITKCRQNMLDYMIPSHFIRLNAFPYNKNGKVDYKQLEKFIDHKERLGNKL